jgi:hypothetical protein
MSATATRPRRAPVVTRLLALVLILGAAAAALLARGGQERPPARLCHPPEACVAALDGRQTLVSTTPSGVPDASLEPGVDGSVSLVGLDGRQRWQVPTDSTAAPQLVAAGDVGTDGVTDYILGLTRPVATARPCGSGNVAETSLVVLDGRTGNASAPFGALRDICWNTPAFNYPTQQWSSGTAYIGEFTRAHRGPEVVVLPYYATHGRVWNFAESGRWRLVRTPSADRFPFPSTPAYDRVYAATNPEPCSALVPGGACHIPNSHVANALFPAGSEGDLFVLTSSRAVVYRPDLTPTSDVLWSPGGNADNGGRNYGLVETYRSGDGTYVDLVGGCSTLNRWRAMGPGADPTGGDANCGIVRHFERFRLAGSRIAQHESVYYGYVGTHGGLDGRVEFPARPHAALGGPATSWTAFNLLRSGAWSTQVFTGPMSTQPMELPGWYVWDTVELEGGGAALLASRVPAGSLVPAWELDILRWNGSSTFASVQHVPGVVPVLHPYASTPSRHSSESSLYGSYVGPGAERKLLVVDAAGKRRFVSLAEADAASG